MGAGFRIENRAAEKRAEIYIYEDVGAGWFGGVTAKDFAVELKGLGAVEAIDLRLNSGGGDVFDGLAIYRLLADHPARVTAHVDGLAASIASVIAMAADEVRMSDSGFMMVHNAWGGGWGEATDLRKLADLLDQTTAAIADVYVKKTNRKPDEVRALMDAETWMSGAEAVERGFADSVVSNIRIAASVVPRVDMKRFPSAPAELARAIARPTLDTARARIERQRGALETRISSRA